MKSHEVPNPAVQRLSLYLRRLEHLAAKGIEKVSSRQLAASLHITDAQLRKDLAYFGQFGRPGVGYLVQPLVKELRRILGTDKIWPVVLVGAGDLGRALLRYRGFAGKGFKIIAAFDVAWAKIGKRAGSVPVRHIDELPRIIREYSVKLAILAVPPEAAQRTTDMLCKAGILGILSFAPTTLDIPSGVVVRPVDIAAKLEELSFRVGRRE